MLMDLKMVGKKSGKKKSELCERLIQSNKKMTIESFCY